MGTLESDILLRNSGVNIGKSRQWNILMEQIVVRKHPWNVKALYVQLIYHLASPVMLKKPFEYIIHKCQNNFCATSLSSWIFSGTSMLPTYIRLLMDNSAKIKHESYWSSSYCTYCEYVVFTFISLYNEWPYSVFIYSAVVQYCMANAGIIFTRALEFLQNSSKINAQGSSKSSAISDEFLISFTLNFCAMQITVRGNLGMVPVNWKRN